MKDGYNCAMEIKPPHRHSIRLPGYDYSQAGAYFVTICTYHRQPLFGEIRDGNMQLNASGRIASAQWGLLPSRFCNLELGEWVIMPNHIHGILVITGSGEASPSKLSVPTNKLIKDASPLHPHGTLPGSVGAIIQNFKSVTSRKINTHSSKYKNIIWQRNYYEHIIRDEHDLQAITAYILTNPQNWDKDEENQPHSWYSGNRR
jgi:REP element-mobilizing transposase RayT